MVTAPASRENMGKIMPISSRLTSNVRVMQVPTALCAFSVSLRPWQMLR